MNVDPKTAPGGRLSALATLLATGFGSGFSPVAPGTAGTLVAVPLALLLPSDPRAQAAVLIAVVTVAVWSADVTARRLGVKDPSRIVVDEIAGYLLSVAFLPPTPAVLIAGFLLFRLFDVAKPPPCRQAEALPGGFGVVTDDLFAGVYSNLSIRLLCAAGILSL